MFTVFKVKFYLKENAEGTPSNFDVMKIMLKILMSEHATASSLVATSA